jgi:hypothetical protein
MQPAVPTVKAPAAPEVTMADSEPTIDAMRSPTLSCSSMTFT